VLTETCVNNRLDIKPGAKPKKQRPCKMSDEKAAAIKAEVQRLLDAKVIREVKYPTWLANTVPVKKKNGKWRMCIDFTDLNKTCPKDDFPLPRIDKIVDDAANIQLMSLLDCFSGYHHIWMRKEDEEKTSFITPFGTYCYVRMPEGLKNAGQSFSRMTSKVLEPQLKRNILAYVIIAARQDHISDLAETFANLRKANLCLNPEKCVFGGTQGKNIGMLGFNQRHRSKPRQNCSPLQHGRATINQGRTKAHKKNCCPEQIHPTLGRPKLAFLQGAPKLSEI